MLRQLFLLLSLTSLAVARDWGFEFGTGPAYRQDRRSWTASAGYELYPHLRMFDWTLSLDASLGPWHLFGDADMGWFSGQKSSLLAPFPEPLSFAFVANGRAATTRLSLGYRFGAAAYATPFVGWVYDSATLHRSHILPPFQLIGPSIASLAFTSNLRQRWQGALAGLRLGWKCPSLGFSASYAYGWLHFNQSFAEITSLTTLQGRTSGSGHGNLATFALLLFLSNQLSLDLSTRYFVFSSTQFLLLLPPPPGISKDNSIRSSSPLS